MPRDAHPTVGVWGTFDVDNYGDHLFPLVVAAELRRRQPRLELRFAAPYGALHPTRFDGEETIRALPPWAVQVAKDALAEHDCILIGGGEIMHGNDRLLAPVYDAHPDELALLRPSGWFLESSTLGSATPVVWNVVGVGCADDPRVARGAASAARVAVRDVASAERLARVGVPADGVDIVPDIAFLVGRVLAGETLDRATAELQRRGGLPRGRFVALQGCDLLVPYANEIAAAMASWLRRHPQFEVALVETGRGRGDGLFADAVEVAMEGRVSRMPPDAGIVDVAATIRAADAFVGSSLHGCITAAVFERPFVTLNLAAEPKLTGLGEVTGRSRFVVDSAELVEPRLTEAVTAPVPVRLGPLQRRIDAHFDHVAALAVARAAARTRTRRRAAHRTRAHPATIRAGGAVVGFVVDDTEALRSVERLTWPAGQRRVVLIDDEGRASGRAAARNRALDRLRDVDHIVFVTADATPSATAIEPLVSALEADPRLGAVVPAVLSDERVATWAEAVMVRRSFIDDVGVFRDDFHAWYEDIDLMLRGARRGWRYGIAASSTVVAGAPPRPSSPFERHLARRNHLLVLAEHAPVRVAAAAIAREALRLNVRVLGGFARRAPRSVRGRLRHAPVAPRSTDALRSWGTPQPSAVPGR